MDSRGGSEIAQNGYFGHFGLFWLPRRHRDSTDRPGAGKYDSPTGALPGRSPAAGLREGPGVIFTVFLCSFWGSNLVDFVIFGIGENSPLGILLLLGSKTPKKANWLFFRCGAPAQPLLAILEGVRWGNAGKSFNFGPPGGKWVPETRWQDPLGREPVKRPYGFPPGGPPGGPGAPAAKNVKNGHFWQKIVIFC